VYIRVKSPEVPIWKKRYGQEGPQNAKEKEPAVPAGKKITKLGDKGHTWRDYKKKNAAADRRAKGTRAIKNEGKKPESEIPCDTEIRKPEERALLRGR